MTHATTTEQTNEYKPTFTFNDFLNMQRTSDRRRPMLVMAAKKVEEKTDSMLRRALLFSL